MEARPPGVKENLRALLDATLQNFAQGEGVDLPFVEGMALGYCIERARAGGMTVDELCTWIKAAAENQRS